jgi:hypothetical protein
MSVFDMMMNDTVTVYTASGVYENVPASVQRGKILTTRTDIPIKTGDRITRKTDAGVIEGFIVDDPGFQSAFHGMPAIYGMRVRRDDAPPRPAVAGTVIYNVTGTGARFNLNSVDNSTNVVHQSRSELFQALRDAIRSNVRGPEREELLARAAEMETAKGKAGFAKRYAEFIACAANHVKIFEPFIPALTQMMLGAGA